jgi:hypothetical protein
VNTALQRAVELLADPPSNPDVSKGDLDLLGSVPAADTPKNTGRIQAAWASPIGSMLYDRAPPAGYGRFQHLMEWLDITGGASTSAAPAVTRRGRAPRAGRLASRPLSPEPRWLSRRGVRRGRRSAARTRNDLRRDFAVMAL